MHTFRKKWLGRFRKAGDIKWLYIFQVPDLKVRAVLSVGTMKCGCYESSGRISSPCSTHTFMIYYIVMILTFKEVKDMVRVIFEIAVFHFLVGLTFFLSLQQIGSCPQGFSTPSSFKTVLCSAKQYSKDFVLVYMSVGPFLHRTRTWPLCWRMCHLPQDGSHENISNHLHNKTRRNLRVFSTGEWDK